MTISSCPRCAKQVTLPVGVGNDAQVRCPLCHAQYTLSEALMNMPPLLELIEDLPAGTPGDGFDSRPEHSAEVASESAADAGDESASPLDELGEELEFEAVEIEHDDFVMQEQDTEVEDLDFSTSDPLVRAVPDEIEPIDVAEPDVESVLNLGQPAEPHEVAAHESSGEDEIALDFGQPELAAESGPGELDFDQPPAREAGEDLGIDFGEAQEAAETGPEMALDFGQPSPREPPSEDEIGLDFGEPVDAPVAAEAPRSPAEPIGKQNKKGKQAPQKKPRETPSGSKRSLVGTLMNIVMPGLIAVPLVYYVGLWISPDYDLLKISGKLPAFMVPSAAKRPTPIAQASPVLPPQMPSPSADEEDAAAQPPASAPETPEAEAAVNETPALPSAEPATPGEEPGEKPIQAPSDPARAEEDFPEPPLPQPEPDAAEPEPEQEPAESTAGESAAEIAPSVENQPEAMPDESADPLADLISSSDEKPEAIPADEKPEEMPATEGDAAVSDPFEDVADAKSADPPAEVRQPAEATEPAEPIEVLGPRDARIFTLADLAKALKDASQANEKMMAAQDAKDDGAIKKVRAGFYLSLYRLADVLTFVQESADPSQVDAQRQGFQQAVLQFAEDPQRLHALKSNAVKWLAYPRRTTPGIMLAGTVQAVEQVGKLYRIQIRLTADAPVVTVVSGTDPQFSPEDEVFVLGSIVEHPDEQLNGYEGGEKAVVWSGMTLKLPPAGN